MSEGTNAALIAEAEGRRTASRLGRSMMRETDKDLVVMKRLAVALDAADTRIAELEARVLTAYDAGFDTGTALVSDRIMQLGAERDAALAAIRAANKVLGNSHLKLGQKTAQARAALMEVPTDES